MKRVSQFVEKSSNYQIDLVKDPVYNDKSIQEFIKLEDINDELFLKYYKTFYDFYVIKNNQNIFNIQAILSNVDGNIEIKYNESEEDKLYRESRKLKNVLKTTYINKSVLKSNLKNLDTARKQNLAKKLIRSAEKYIAGKETTGYYVYGKTGIGKTFIMGALYNYLNSIGKEPAIIYFPDFARKIKSGFETGSFNEIIDQIREQEILIIDDIGAEHYTNFIRDEVLIPIINYRSDEKLLTYFTSNLSIADLTRYLANTKDTVDETKALRIARRISDLAEEEYLDM
ncbi:MAG: ATP-binding protein [Gemella sp.]|nr:ATP-binding protein [Gemella sp.]